MNLTYESAPYREPVLIAGSAGFYEVVVNRGNAAKDLGMTLADGTDHRGRA